MMRKDELKDTQSNLTSLLCILSTGAKTVWGVVVATPFRELGFISGGLVHYNQGELKLCRLTELSSYKSVSYLDEFYREHSYVA